MRRVEEGDLFIYPIDIYLLSPMNGACARQSKQSLLKYVALSAGAHGLREGRMCYGV